MAEDNMGGVGYKIRISGDTSSFLRTMEQAKKAEASFTAGIDKMVSRFEKSMNKLDQAAAGMGRSAKKAGDTIKSGMGDAEKSIRPSIMALQDISNKFRDVESGAKSIGNNDGVRKAAQAIEHYKDMTARGFESTAQMSAETSRLNRVFKEVQQETKAYNDTMLKMEKSIGAAEREVQTITARMTAFGASEKEITPLNAALKQYRNDLKAAGSDTVKIQQANETYKTSINEVKNSMERKSKSVRGATGDNSEFVKQMQNSTKAVQLALGPLSGIAARITAFTALIRTNTVSIAGFTAAITGLVVATNRIVKTGIEYERQLLSLEAAISATGRSAETTVDEIDAMARSVAAATLTNSTAARQSLNMLMSMQNVTVDMMKEVTITAQGMASVMGGNLTSTTRMLGRALEQPSSSLDSLRRVGIQFTEVQKDMIRSFEATGQVAKAQGVILDQTRAFYESAQKEAEGLAGQIDAMKDNFQTLFEEISKQIDTNDRLSEVYQTVNDSILALIDNQERIGNIISGVSSIVSVAGKVLTAFANNIEIVAAALTGMFVGAATKGAMALYGFTMGLKKGSAAAATAAIAFKGVSLAMLPVSAAIATTVLGYVALTRGMSRNEDSTKKVQKAHEALAAPFADTELSLDNIRLSLVNVNQEMINTAKLTERQLETSLKTALQGASVEWNNYADSIGDAMDRAMKSMSPNDSDVMGGIGVNPRTIAAIEETTAAFEGFGSDVEDVYNKINAGTAVSAEVIQTLRERALELEIPSDFINMLDKLNKSLLQTQEASKAVQDMTRILREGTISLPSLLENVTKSFGDLIYNIDDLNERTLIKAQQEFINTGDNAERMFDQIFNGMRANAYAKFGNDLFGLTMRLKEIDAEQQAAADSARGLFAAWEAAKLKSVTDDFRAIGREMQLMAAGTDEARAALEHMHSVQDRFFSLYAHFEGAKTVADLGAALKAANAEMLRHGQTALFTESMIQALTSGEIDLAEALEIVRAKMMEVSAITTQFETSTRTASRSTNDLTSKLESLKSSLDPVYAANREYEQAQKILNTTMQDGAEKTRLLNLAEERRDKTLRGITTPMENFKALTGEMVKAVEQELNTMEMLNSELIEAETTREVYQTALDNNIALEGDHAEEIQKVIDKIVALKKELQDKQNIGNAMESLGLPNPSQMAKEFDAWIQSARDQKQFGLADLLEDKKAFDVGKALESLTSDMMTGSPEDISMKVGMKEFMLAEQFGRESELFKQHLADLEITAAQSNIFEGLNDQANTYMTTMNDVSSGMAQMINGLADFGKSSVDTTDALVNTMGGLLSTMSAMGREQTKEFQMIALVQAAINQALAVSKVFADPTVPVWVAPAMAATAAAAVGAQIAAIQSQSFATGGFVSGKGSSTSDSIPANLSDGEYVLQASAVKKLGISNLNMMNEGRMDSFSGGGAVGAVPVPMGNSSSPVNIQVIDQTSGSHSYETEESVDANGTRQIKLLIREAVRESIHRGEMDQTMAQNYGSKRKGKKR